MKILFQLILASLKKHQKVCCPEELQEEPSRFKKCTFCNRTFIKQNSHLYKNHCDMHTAFKFLHENDSFMFNECLECQKVFCTKEKLKEHVCTRNSTEFHCTECDKKYDSILSLKEHFIFFHHNYFPCPVGECVIEKKSYNLIYYHIQKSHAGFISCITSFPCEYCKTDFESYYLLERHRKNGSCNAKKFICDHCGNTYGHKRDIAAHLLSNMRRFICNYCGKACRDTHSLNIHIRSHTQEKPFECKVCTKKFSTQMLFTMHSRTHTNIRRYECAYCEHKSTTIPLLKKHEKLHTERLQCPVCNNLLSTRFAVSSHLKTVHQVSDTNDLQKLMQTVKRFLIEPESLRRKRGYRLTDVH